MSKVNLEKVTIKNKYFRNVIQTGKHLQLVLMCLDPGVEIGEETHSNTDQFFRVDSGIANAKVGDKKYILKEGDSLLVPAGNLHNVWCSSKAKEPVKLYTVYSNPEHKQGAKQKTVDDKEL